MTKCPNCGSDLHFDKKGTGLVFKEFTICFECKHAFRRDKPGKIKIYEQQPLDQMETIDKDFVSDYSSGDIVACSDSRHQLFLEFGEVVKTEHIHVRVKFFIGKTIWMTDPIIEKVPEEWKD